MTPPVFVVAPGELVSAVAGSCVRVTGSEARHAVTVMRVSAGERVQLVDGQGVRATGTVVRSPDRQALDVEVIAVTSEVAPSLRLTAVQALAKGERGELAVEQLTEIGADEIVPWAAAASVVQWRADRVERSRQRWVDAAMAAAKQSRRARFPVIAPLASTDDVLARVRTATVALVLHESARHALADVAVPQQGEVLLVVGPEGGITPVELTAFLDAGATAVRLGPTVLRTSSAGMVAAGIVLAASPRWRIGRVEG
ncbi:MAG: 16S rRNA (uracil(1498)-N(3))-methyltransferase [Actinomycetota bacterium]|nr:16S rRNA (uracil(1498)-N(3))-methyltransferase [Actinomycetota bacterium]